MDNMVGQRIKQRRKELNVTQTQIQTQTSVSSGNLSCIENGKYLPSATALLELSKILKCSIDWILTGNSLISDNSEILDIKEQELLKSFNALLPEDKDEILDIIELKLRRSKRDALASEKSSHSHIETA